MIHQCNTSCICGVHLYMHMLRDVMHRPSGPVFSHGVTMCPKQLGYWAKLTAGLAHRWMDGLTQACAIN